MLETKGGRCAAGFAAERNSPALGGTWRCSHARQAPRLAPHLRSPALHRVTAELDIFGKKTRVDLSPGDISAADGDGA